MQPPPAHLKIPNFTDETLFFIFYSQPRDYMQELAAAELCVRPLSSSSGAGRWLTRRAHRYKHNWRYHKELKLWLTKESGVEPTQKTATYERGSYIFFDPLGWEKSKVRIFAISRVVTTRPERIA